MICSIIFKGREKSKFKKTLMANYKNYEGKENFVSTVVGVVVQTSNLSIGETEPDRLKFKASLSYIGETLSQNKQTTTPPAVGVGVV
jgi:hypothetical protein